MDTIKSLLAGYREQKFSPPEITRKQLERARQNQHLNAFILQTEDIALQQAEIAERRWNLEDAGRLEGIPVSYKDNIYVKGLPATSGSLIDKHFVPKHHARAVRDCNREGAVMIGKTNMHEFAFGITNNNPFYGPARNPWNSELIAGGSSGGSAVSVAGGSAAGSLGTDTGGSVRIPAACCGLVGFKPTYNLVKNSGVTLISWSLDHIGPIAGTVDDIRIMMEALTECNFEIEDERKQDLKGIKVGVPVNHFTNRCEREILAVYKKALQQFEQLGAQLVEVEVPDAELAGALTFTIATAEAASIHRWRAAKYLKKYGEDVRLAIDAGATVPAVEYIEARKRQKAISFACERLFTDIDLLMTPSLPALPKPIGQEEVTIDGQTEPIFNCMIRYTSYFNLTGHPVLSLPVGMTSTNLPASVQLISAKGADSELLRLAKIYEDYHLLELYQRRRQLSFPDK